MFFRLAMVLHTCSDSVAPESILWPATLVAMLFASVSKTILYVEKFLIYPIVHTYWLDLYDHVCISIILTRHR